MNYLAIYDRLMERAKGRKLKPNYIEIHHIIPKSFFSDKTAADDPVNLIELTQEEHFLAHLLLLKMVHGEHLIKMNQALAMMRGNKRYGKCTNKKYGARKRRSNYKKRAKGKK